MNICRLNVFLSVLTSKLLNWHEYSSGRFHLRTKTTAFFLRLYFQSCVILKINGEWLLVNTNDCLHEHRRTEHQPYSLHQGFRNGAYLPFMNSDLLWKNVQKPALLYASCIASRCPSCRKAPHLTWGRADTGNVRHVSQWLGHALPD